MSILDVFYILFEGKTDGLKKSSEEAKKHLKDVEGQTKKSEESTQKLGDSFMGIAQKVGILAASYASLSTLKSGITGIVEQNTELANNSKFLDVNANQLNAWANAVKATGYSADAFKNTIQSLALQFIEMGQPEKAANIFNYLKELNKQFQGMSETQSKNVGMKLGLDQGTIAFLMQSTDEFEKQIAAQEKLNTLDQTRLDQSKRLTEVFASLDTAASGFWTAFIDSSFPAIEGAINLGIKFLGILENAAKTWKDMTGGEGFVTNWGRLILPDWMQKKLLPEKPKDHELEKKTTTEPAGIFLDEPYYQTKPRKGPPDISDLMQKSNEQMSIANNSAISHVGKGGVSAQYGNNQNTEIKIDSVIVNTQATDVDAIAREVSGALKSELRNTSANFGSGEDY